MVEAVGQPIAAWVMPASQMEYQQVWSQVMRGGRWRGEWQSKTKQGATYLAAVSISPLYDADQEITGVLITQEDITERKDLERLAVVVRDAYDAITVFNFAGQILAWNPSAGRLYGWREAEALTMTVFEMVSQEHKAPIGNMIVKLRQGEALAPLEIMHHCRDGTVVAVLLTATTLLDDNGVPYAIATTEKSIVR